MKAPRVRQFKGKGMNAGGANPRASSDPRPVADKETVMNQGSYLPQQAFAAGGKVRAMSYGKGSKVISCSCGMK